MSEAWPVPDVLAHLAGRWHVERTVRDLAYDAVGTFSGTTDFTSDDAGGLLHHEAGTFVRHGTARPAERNLRFLPGEAPARPSCGSPTAASSTTWTCAPAVTRRTIPARRTSTAASSR